MIWRFPRFTLHLLTISHHLLEASPDRQCKDSIAGGPATYGVKKNWGWMTVEMSGLQGANFLKILWNRDFGGRNDDTVNGLAGGRSGDEQLLLVQGTCGTPAMHPHTLIPG